MKVSLLMKNTCEITSHSDEDGDIFIVIHQRTTYTLSEYLTHASEIYKYALSLRGDIHNDKASLLEKIDE